MSAPKGGRFVHGFETKYTGEGLLNGDMLLTVPTNSILTVTAKFTIAESLMVKSVPASRLRLTVELKVRYPYLLQLVGIYCSTL